jgi:protein-L-isoaspartate(D-aspartate) O-methyltransferase
MTDYAVPRLHMVESQLRPNQVTDEAVLEAFLAVPRERFVPPSLERTAYIDGDLPLGGRRYLLEPMVLARLLQFAAITPEDSVLDIGCATGYGAAVLERLARQVVAIDSDARLVEQATARLRVLGNGRATAITAPMVEGYPAQAPYDVVVIEGAVAHIPEAIERQVAESGRLVTVIQDGGGMGRAVLMTRTAGVLSHRPMFDAAAPLLPGFERAPSFQF